MKPVLQTKFRSEKQNGNCLAAAIASILELPLDLVPQFEEHFNKPSLWQDSMFHFLAGHGLRASHHEKDGLWDFPYIAEGLSPRSKGTPWRFNHAVVYQRGQMIHDPHPSGQGLAGAPVGFITLERIENFSDFAIHEHYDRLVEELDVMTP